MGLGEIIGVLIFAIIINIWLWHSGFYSRKKKMNKDDIEFQVGDKTISGDNFDNTVHKVAKELIKQIEEKEE